VRHLFEFKFHPKLIYLMHRKDSLCFILFTQCIAENKFATLNEQNAQNCFKTFASHLRNEANRNVQCCII